MRQGLIRRSVVALLAVGLVAAACATGDGDDVEQAATDESPDVDDSSDEGGDAPPDGDERRILEAVISEETTSLVPHVGTEQGRGAVFHAIHMPILEPDVENDLYSKVLESWEITDDALTVTLTMKPDLEWSDGAPMTADDIVMTLTQYLDGNISAHAGRIGGVLGQQAFTDGEADSIEGLNAVDDRTIEIQLETPDVAWIPNLAVLQANLPILPSHILGDVPHDELLDHEYFRTHEVSSGPFKLADFVEGQFVELERNDNWSLGDPYFERVFLKIIDTDVMSAQLETREIQFMFPVDSADAERIGNLQGIELVSHVGTAPELWSIMHDVPLDTRVRQAMLFAIDREAICEQALQGFCSTPVTNIRQITPEWSLPTQADFPDLIEYRYDPDRARELLAEAEADGAWDPNTTLTFFARPGRSYVETALSIAQGQMAEVGINWEIINTDTAGLLDGIREQPPGTLDGFWVSGANFTIDPSAVQVYASCDTAKTGANLISYCDPELDELWFAGRQETDPDARAEIYKEAFYRMNQDPAEIYLYIIDTIVAHDERLKGVTGHGNISSVYWNIGEWFWEE